jgi:hypothetical protein
MTLGYKVCAEMVYPSGLKIHEWNYYTVNDETLLPSEWETMSDDDKATYLNEDINCHWVKGWLDGDEFEVADAEAGLQTYKIVELEKW